MRKNLRLGLFGFGCVGQGLYHVLEETQGIKAGIKKICVKHRDKKRFLPAEFFTYEKLDILNDPEIDVVVEMIDDAEAAFHIVKTALQNGKAVVTANKKMLAEHLEEIRERERAGGLPGNLDPGFNLELILLFSGLKASCPRIEVNAEAGAGAPRFSAVTGLVPGSERIEKIG